MRTDQDTPISVAQQHKSVGAGREQKRAWLALLFTVGLVAALYLALSLAVSADPLLMPLDDTYIHFQYAREFAQGRPLVYNPGDPATSGGTSLLYPPLLALGYLIGFEGWSLAYWALAIGVLSFFGAAWLVYLIARDNPLPLGRPREPGYALWMACAFALSGPFIWAALSGMETMLFVFAALLTLYFVQQGRLVPGVIAAGAMVLVRPEGAFLAALAALALALREPWPRARRVRLRRAVWLAVPLAASLIQPAINLLATGSATSSGMAAKSHLANSAAPWDARLEAILSVFETMWRELLSGRSPQMGTYVSPVLADAALAVLLVGVWLAWRARRANILVVMLAWIAVLTVAASTLDTAFWQFKRYQLPVMALFFPAAAWASTALGAFLQRHAAFGWLRWGLPILILVPSALTTITFARNYADNVAVVRDQQVVMARWVRDHLPEDARVGAHDVGLVRYFGNRALYDVVGLTTPGAAEAWRQGSGAIYEAMASSDYRPDYFAIYPDVQGLRYLLDAGVFGEVLAEFPVELPEHNVASATDYQAVYRADWSATRPEEQVAQTTTLGYVDGLERVDQVDVADLSSEADHDYRWWQDGTPPGYVTEVYRHPYRQCGLEGAACSPTDGGRVLTGGEEFSLRTRPGEDLLLVTRVHGRASVRLWVSVNGQRLAQRVQPAVPGRWLEVVTYVPAAQLTGNTTHIRIEAEISDPRAEAYQPYYHWAYQGAFALPDEEPGDPVATFGAGGAIRLLDYSLDVNPGSFEVSLTWLGDAPGAGDGIVFVHLYNSINAAPVAQTVARPAGDVLPPGNWLPGTIRDVYTVSLPDDLPPGAYPVAIGLFDADSGARYPATGPGADQDGRLFIGEITIEESAQ